MVVIREVIKMLIAMGAGGAVSWYLYKTFSDKIRQEVDKALRDIKRTGSLNEEMIVDRVKATYENVLKDHDERIANITKLMSSIKDKVQFIAESIKEKNNAKKKEAQ